MTTNDKMNLFDDMFRTGQTVIVQNDLVTLGRKTTRGTVARILPASTPALMTRREGWYAIVTMSHPSYQWLVQAQDIAPAPRPWSWYQSVHPRATAE